jgi:cytochrome c peroxidase
MSVNTVHSTRSDIVGRSRRTRRLLPMVAMVCTALLCLSAGIEAGSQGPNPTYSIDPTGVLSTYRTDGGIDLANPFFQSLGTNGRSCGSCHVAEDGWTVTPPRIQARFVVSGGTDPIFRPVDGAVCPDADVSTLTARVRAYRLLLQKGLIRVSMGVPGNADFSITGIQDPYNCSQTTATNPALYRRPLPATNLGFLSAVMWDGRETVFGAIPGKSIDLDTSLGNQAFDATMGHAQASKAPTAQQVADIVAFEKANFTAQVADIRAGFLTSNGAQGGPKNLSQQPFYIGINDALGGDPNGVPFDSSAFTIYNTWMNSSYSSQRSVARGQALFNTYPIAIKGVGGLPDMQGTCTTCHDSPNVGNHSFSVPLAIGTSDYPALAPLDVAGLPVYTVQCSDGTVKHLTDLGRAMRTGNCADLAKVKGPILRGLAARAPYFHNGSAATLRDVVEFYNQRFSLNLTDQQKADLTAFLQTL